MIKILKTPYLFYIIGAGIFLVSCKYKEGPIISFRSKVERMSNSWKIDKFDHDGVDITRNFEFVTLNIEKGGNFNIEVSDPVFNRLVEQHFRSFQGKWYFDADKEEVFFEYSSPWDTINGGRDLWTILKLYEDEVWLEIDLPGKHNRKEMYLKPK